MEDAKVDVTPVEPKVDEWTLRAQIEAELRPKLRSEYEQILLLWKETELDKVRKESEKIAEEGIKKLFDDWKKSQEPPTHEQLQEILSQEYETFNLPIDCYGDDGKSSTKTFTIRELPQAVEKKFYRQFKDKIIKNIGAVKALTQATIDQSFDDKAQAFLNLFDESFDALAETVVLVLNPFGKDQSITKQWVQENIPSKRQWDIVSVQIKVNKLKDFFSELSQSGQSTQMMLEGLNFQQLQQLAR